MYYSQFISWYNINLRNIFPKLQYMLLVLILLIGDKINQGIKALLRYILYDGDK